tara:strand:- start:1809 stop:2042 length:234 start_codon:yes stop_codon:yes gene_type:complete
LRERERNGVVISKWSRNEERRVSFRSGGKGRRRRRRRNEERDDENAPSMEDAFRRKRKRTPGRWGSLRRKKRTRRVQ